MVPGQRRIQPLVSQLAAVYTPLAAAALPAEPPVALQQVFLQGQDDWTGISGNRSG
jgi:hypothetical protein